jgi:hypothetical protein
LLGEVDSYVLQVHSVPLREQSAHSSLCDPYFTRGAIKNAARLGRAFALALPTYGCLGGYGADGKLLSVAMDSVQPAWPNGTRVLEFASDPVALAHLVHELQQNRPRSLNALVWYRVPTEADQRNWRWPTLGAVREGREPTHALKVACTGENPIDIALINDGEAEERSTVGIVASWQDAVLVASDAVAGWNVSVTSNAAVFKPDLDAALRLLPGERRAIGWLRYERPTQPQLRFAAETR